MPKRSRKTLYLPRRDRSFWQEGIKNKWPLLYMAWGRRDFAEEYLPPCRHEGWTCVVIEEGQPEMIVGDEKIRLGRGMMVLIGPECPFGWSQKEGNRCKFVLWMWNELKLGVRAGVGDGDFKCNTLSKQEQESLLQNHEQCRREGLATDGLSGKFFTSCRMSFEILIRRLLEADPEAPPQERYEHAVEWVKTHLDSKKPVARLCDYLNMSQSSLHRLFKERTEVSPANFIHRTKMEHAREQLRSGKHQVKEVALQLGYSQSNDFSRAYRDYFGCSPSKELN